MSLGSNILQFLAVSAPQFVPVSPRAAEEELNLLPGTSIPIGLNKQIM